MATVLGVRLGVYITHTYRRDLMIELQGPDGSTVTLALGDGSSGDDFGSGTADSQLCILDDTAIVALADLAAGDSSTGRFIPDEALATFNDADPVGTWTVTVTDTSPEDTGAVQKLSLFIDTEGGTLRLDIDGPTDLPDAIVDPPYNYPVAFAFVVTDELLPTFAGLILRPLEPGFFRIKFTSLHYPPNPGLGLGRRPAKTLGYVNDFADAEVVIPINDSRTASLTMAITDPALAQVRPYSTRLHITYVTPAGGHLVFWGIVTLPEWDSPGETVKISAVDDTLRMKSDYVRFGDRILNGSDHPDLPNPFNDPGHHHSVGYVPIDAVGIQYLIDCARNLDTQTARGVPDIGLEIGSDDTTHLPTDTEHVIGLKRGRETWDAITDLLSHQIAPDVEVVPHDGEFGVYARVRFHDHQGSLTPVITLQDGFGKDNCLVTYKPGGKLFNHAHVLSDGDKERVTVADAASSEEYGNYITWESTSYTGKNTDVLQSRGEQIIAAYGQPPDYFSIALNSDCGLYYLDDFIVGDATRAQVRRGQLQRDLVGDITTVRLKQIDRAGNVVPDIDVLVAVGDVSDGEDS